MLLQAVAAVATTKKIMLSNKTWAATVAVGVAKILQELAAKYRQQQQQQEKNITTAKLEQQQQQNQKNIECISSKYVYH